MLNTIFKVSESYKFQEGITGELYTYESKLQFSFIEKIGIIISLKFESNRKNLRIVEAKLVRVESDKNGDLSVNLSFNNTIHQGCQATRIIINLSFESQKQNAVGSLIVKLTPSGTLIQFNKTNNVSDLEGM